MIWTEKQWKRPYEDHQRQLDEKDAKIEELETCLTEAYTMIDSIRSVYEYDIKRLKTKLAPLRDISAQAFMDERNCMLQTQNELQAEIGQLREAAAKCICCSDEALQRGIGSLKADQVEIHAAQSTTAEVSNGTPPYTITNTSSGEPNTTLSGRDER